jgi:hypothetical protein
MLRPEPMALQILVAAAAVVQVVESRVVQVVVVWSYYQYLLPIILEHIPVLLQ